VASGDQRNPARIECAKASLIESLSFTDDHFKTVGQKALMERPSIINVPHHFRAVSVPVKFEI
jgi:hypothetical protein